jgi:hypothetical protein
MNIEETIFFYSRNDYLIINNILAGNMNELWYVAELANGDSKGVMEEHKIGVRVLDAASIERFSRRVYDELNEAAKAKILQNAKNDISNIIAAMKTASREILLYRTVWQVRPEIDDRPSNYAIGDIIEFKTISSTSITPFMEEAGHDFYRYEISVPKGGLILELDQFDRAIRNETGEVLLPPMTCKVKNLRYSNNEKCRGINELDYIEKLQINTIK